MCMASVCMGIGKWGFPKVADLEFSTLYSIHISIHALLYKYSVAKVFKWRKVGFPGPSPLAGIRKNLSHWSVDFLFYTQLSLWRFVIQIELIYHKKAAN